MKKLLRKILFAEEEKKLLKKIKRLEKKISKVRDIQKEIVYTNEIPPDLTLDLDGSEFIEANLSKPKYRAVEFSKEKVKDRDNEVLKLEVVELSSGKNFKFFKPDKYSTSWHVLPSGKEIKQYSALHSELETVASNAEKNIQETINELCPNSIKYITE